ncbi:MAG: carboxypeptidase-like regulatory domain-containing protein [Opitutaceae bacterium]|nr:carboxypeptidase-like regulatory domain-containing protein [Opitutaceae bacterium]
MNVLCGSPRYLHSAAIATSVLLLAPILARPATAGTTAEPARLTGSAASAAQGTGTIEGRVINRRTGDYLERARVSVEGTAIESFTDSDGNYRLTNVPAGRVRLRAFYTGLPAQLAELDVTSGQSLRRDIALAPDAQGASGDGAPIRMDEFVVDTSREMSGAAIAINEQRFAANTKTVVATDELGFVPEGNVADFIKFLPGVTIEDEGGFARDVSINGVPSDYVPITVDGFSLASAHPSGNSTGRNAALDMVSINNLSRVEVLFSPTPESPGSALAGSVNLVPRSSFERARPVFNVSAYLLMRDNARDFNKTPGPFRNRARKVHPGIDFSYLRPVNARFGFTLSGGTSTNYLDQDFSQNTWRGTSAATNGNAFPHTTPDRPYLTSYLVRDNPKESTRNSFSATADYKLTPNDRLSFSFQYTSTAFQNRSRTLTFNVNRVALGAFSPTFTHGSAGAGSIQQAIVGQTRDNRTYMPSLVWRHLGPEWHAEAGLAHSHARAVIRSTDQGFFNNSTASRSGVTVSFDDIFYLRPGTITVTDAAGAPLDPYSLGNYVVTNATANTRSTADQQRSAYANLRRDFRARVPFTLKAGLDVREARRDLRNFNQPYTYAGADGRTSTAPAGSDDLAVGFLDVGPSQRAAPFGFPRIQWLGSELLWEHYVANPGHFRLDEAAEYRSTVNGSKGATEIVSAGYLRGDLPLLGGRLKLVGGVRAEQTNIKAEGPLTDPTRNFQRNARGEPILGPNGRPLPVTTNALDALKLTLVAREARTRKEYLRFFPSLNASFSLRENLIARAAHYYSIGRPNFNQYAGGITLPDLEDAPSPSNRIGVNNAAIKPWSARTTNVRLEYYFEGVGQISVAAFRRDFEIFFGSTRFTPTPQFLALYGLDAATYGEYEVATQENVTSTVRMTGVNVNYKQALTFLPRWARGLQVFANGSAQRATGDAADNFSGYVPRSASWGVSLTRERYNVRVNWNYRGRVRRGDINVAPSIEPGTFNWGQPRLNIDVQGEYYFWNRVAVFASMRNVGDATDDVEVAGPSTPPHAQFRSRQDFGSLWTIGLKGTF